MFLLWWTCLIRIFVMFVVELWVLSTAWLVCLDTCLILINIICLGGSTFTLSFPLSIFIASYSSVLCQFYSTLRAMQSEFICIHMCDWVKQMADRGRGRGHGRGRGCGHDQELPPPPPMTIEQLIMIQTQVMQGMTQAVTTMHQAQQQPPLPVQV